MQVSRLFVLVFVMVARSAFAGGGDGPRPLWGGLEPGPHSVGFRSFWSLDLGRVYWCEEAGLSRDGKSPRPVLVNLWYPAAPGDGEPMSYGGYLRIASDDPRLAPFASFIVQLAAYELEVVCGEVIGASIDESDATKREALDRLLATPTAAVRDAAAAEGRFPLVIYHAGYGSSFDDNAVLCEYLASHGYVVVGSAFQEAGGESFNIDAGDDSIADMEHLVRIAAGEPMVDRARVGLIGHSGGAHTAFRFVSRWSRPVDALVSLDTTQDYHSFADTRWDDFVPLALDNADIIDLPIMFAARQHAMFRLGDCLTASPRTYITLRDLEHNSFISQGVMWAETTGEANAAAVRDGYEELCRAVLLFLDKSLRGSEEAGASLRARWAGAAPGESAVVAEFAAVGEGAPVYDPASARPPTPRQMAAILDGGDSRLAGDLLERFRDHPRARPFAETEFAMSVETQLVLEGREDEARAMLGRFSVSAEEIVRIVRAHEAMYRRIGADRAADRYAKVVRALTE